MNILAIDPGNIESAYCLIDCDTYKPIKFDKVPNSVIEHDVIPMKNIDLLAIEMIAHYGCGMPAGKSVFDTCVWIGRFQQEAESFGARPGEHIFMIYRKDEKMNLCGTMKAKDGNIIQALVDRFAPETSNRGKGTKKNPGWFYGFHADVWQAYAVGVTCLDLIARQEG